MGYLLFFRLVLYTFRMLTKEQAIKLVGKDVYEKLIKDIDLLDKRKLVVIDEAHFLKNPDTQKTKAVKKYLEEAELGVLLIGRIKILDVNTALVNGKEYMFCSPNTSPFIPVSAK